MLEMLPGFVVAVALLAMVPGPATALVIRQTIRDGRRTALITTAGSAAVKRRLERLTGLVLLGLGARLAAEHR